MSGKNALMLLLLPLKPASIDNVRNVTIRRMDFRIIVNIVY